jgi:hypothetical protein
MLRTVIWQSAVLLGVGANAGCRVVQCLPPEPSASIIAAQSRGDRGLVIRGRVTALETGKALLSARVRVTGVNSAWRSLSPDGTLSVRAARPGSYIVDVTAPGYDLANRIVTVSPDSGVVWAAVMVRSRSQRRDRGCVADTTSNVAADSR